MLWGEPQIRAGEVESFAADDGGEVSPGGAVKLARAHAGRGDVEVDRIEAGCACPGDLLARAGPGWSGWEESAQGDAERWGEHGADYWIGAGPGEEGNRRGCWPRTGTTMVA